MIVGEKSMRKNGKEQKVARLFRKQRRPDIVIPAGATFLKNTILETHTAKRNTFIKYCKKVTMDYRVQYREGIYYTTRYITKTLI